MLASVYLFRLFGSVHVLWGPAKKCVIAILRVGMVGVYVCIYIDIHLGIHMGFARARPGPVCKP